MEKKSKQISRRNFFKLTAGAGVGVSLASLNTVGKSVQKSVAYAGVPSSQQHNDFPLEISKDYKRFNQKNCVFSRSAWDPIVQKTLSKEWGMPRKGEPGYEQIDIALNRAGWAIEFYRRNIFDAANGDPNIGMFSFEGPTCPEKYSFSNPEEASRKVKRAAEYLGADLVGIADFDERWVYSEFHSKFKNESTPAQFPFNIKSVIAIAIEMPYEGVKCSPSNIADAATGVGYSKMVEVAYKLTVFLRQLGYKSFASGNDTALSIPIAIQAGLGELGRNGMLITEKYGPRVRICKVFTELPLKADKPISFGVQEFCKVCMKCADTCPSESISKDREPSFEVRNISNNPGVKKWAVDGVTCHEFWQKNGATCSNCIQSCPYNKIEEWHHQLSMLATHTPAKPVLRYLDEFFGYGRTYDQEAMLEFWKK